MSFGSIARQGADIIYALASGQPPAAIAVMRLSGPGTWALLDQIIVGAVPVARKASVRRLIDPRTDHPLDDALVLTFDRGASYTGEESAELHLHGGEMVVAAVEGVLIALGARMAKPGEFSRRALAEGRIDVAQAESIAALIHAETESARLQALRIMDGDLGVQVQQWRDDLIEAAAYLETGVDFVDEDLGDDLIAAAAHKMLALLTDLSAHLESARGFDTDDTRLSVVFVGPPNAGKSSLLNAITGRDLAIVTDIAGTTRDVLRTSLKVAGVSLELADTAGQRESVDRVEAEGVARAQKAAASAWRRIYVLSQDTLAEAGPVLQNTPPRAGDAIFWTKADAFGDAPSELQARYPGQIAIVSARDSSSRAAILTYIEQQRPLQATTPSPIAGSERRAGLIAEAIHHLTQARTLVLQGSVELSAAELRDTMQAIESLIGSVDHEQVLDLVFSRFCIGK